MEKRKGIDINTQCAKTRNVLVGCFGSASELLLHHAKILYCMYTLGHLLLPHAYACIQIPPGT